MAAMHVHIRGDGLAAWCCAQLLSKSGFRPSIDRSRRSKLPLILVSDPTQALLCEIAGDPLLFRRAPRIRKRVVLWGPGAEPSVLEHSSAVVSEQALLGDLWSRSGFNGGSDNPDWTIVAVPPAPGREQHFGSRTASIAEVDLKGERETCWIESFEDRKSVV
jgi:hypothetical protein